MKRFILLLSGILIVSTKIHAQDSLFNYLSQFICAANSSTTTFCHNYPTYFSMTEDTLNALVVFVSYPDGDYDPIRINSNLIYMQYWPGTNNQHLQKPIWADSVICPATTNIWNPSLTGLFAQSSNNKFWLIGDVYDSLVILQHNFEYYSSNNNRGIGLAVKEAIDKINPYVDFSMYDKLDPCDVNLNNNRREPDGVVDFIFIIFRLNYSGVIDPPSYTGINCLGGRQGSFGNTSDSNIIIRDNKQIYAFNPGSGCIAEMYFKWMIGPAAHEFAQHYGYGAFHLDGLGGHSINGGGIACAYDREHFGWTSGNVYQPTSNTTNIQLRDYITTGDYLKVLRNGKTYFIENRRRLNYYSSNSIHGWRWTANEPLLPVQRDSGLLIYKIISGGYETQHGFGKWDWETCSNGRFIIKRTPYYNEFIPKTVNKFYGKTAMNLFQLNVADINCNTVVNQYTSSNIFNASYIGWEGDTNMCYDIDFNMVYSPWSNPAIPITSSSDSLTIELSQRNSDGSLSVNVYFTSITQASPSKPQLVKAIRDYFGSPVDAFHPKIIWNRNTEPDLSRYNIYRGLVSTAGIEPSTYYSIGTTTDTVFLDNSITLYRTGGGSGPCSRLTLTYSYKVSAIDSTEKESVKSQRDSVYGYYDPCGAYEEDSQNETENNENLLFGKSLLQNYPNPFNPVTIIKYSIEKSGFVHVTVFDILGKEIAILTNEYKLAGKYEIEFDAAKYNLSSGIYFYKLETNEFSDIKRMLILK